MRTVSYALGVQAQGFRPDALARGEVPIHVIHDLVHVHARMTVRTGNSLLVDVHHPRTERADHESISGEIISNWKYEGMDFSMEVKVPVNVSASIYVPAASVDEITENGMPAVQSVGLKFDGMEGAYAVFKAGSGTYSFVVNTN